MSGNCGLRASRTTYWIQAAIPVAIFLAHPAYATNLTITPSFDTSITSDPNAIAIENTIRTAINFYETTFSNPINVNIDFQEMSSGLGESFTFFTTRTYTAFYAAYQNNATTHNNTVALDALAGATPAVPSGTRNPLTNTTTINLKTANIRALGIACGSVCSPTFDGTISLNTSLTFPPNGASSATYSLLADAEHEIDEVLGLGSALPNTPPGGSIPNNDPFPEDLFRFDASGARNFSATCNGRAFFSVDRTTDLAEFDNQCDGGDFGDWRSNPLPNGAEPEVQDAFVTPGITPSMGPAEIRALEAIGYDLAVPEPGSMLLLATALPFLGICVKRFDRTA